MAERRYSGQEVEEPRLIAPSDGRTHDRVVEDLAKPSHQLSGNDRRVIP